MTVRELIDMLENFDDDTDVLIGMEQIYGSDFAMEIRDVSERNVTAFGGEDCKAVVLTEGEQCGVVDYDDEY